MYIGEGDSMLTSDGYPDMMIGGKCEVGLHCMTVVWAGAVFVDTAPSLDTEVESEVVE